jgi:outer membrane protein OmpA-like peptidoglycan-associated protein
MKLKAILLGAVAATVLTGAARADYARDGWYVGIEGGWVRVNETEYDTIGIPIALDDGWGALATVGFAFRDSNWRIEGEVGYRKNDGIGTAPVTGPIELEEWTGMLNAVYDFRLASDRWGLSLGAGAGIDNPRFTNVAQQDSSDVVFAFQGIAGITYRMSQHWDLMLTYRYLNAAQAALLIPAGPEDDVDFEKHTVTVGFRYGYDEPPAPPVAAPPVAAVPPPKPTQFIVFFGYNKCNVTAEADAVLSEAAASAKSNGSASIRIVGHTDTSGSNAYNQKLSECRANAVQSNLVGKGVPQGSISASGKGETELMVQTGDGVKEPQNRRATIDLN